VGAPGCVFFWSDSENNKKTLTCLIGVGSLLEGNYSNGTSIRPLVLRLPLLKFISANMTVIYIFGGSIAPRLSNLMVVIKSQQLKGLGYCVLYRHKNTQQARQVGILGAEGRAPPLIRKPVMSLLARIAKHIELPDATIERTWPSASLKERDPPIKRMILRPRQDKRGSVLPCLQWCIQT
jgi:hypothetical protein